MEVSTAFPCSLFFTRDGRNTFEQKASCGRHLPTYMCLAECERPLELDSTRDEWIKHMTEDHERSQHWLRCACNQPSKFTEERHFVAHLTSQHVETIPSDQIPFFVSECCCVAPLEISSCPPLCPLASPNADVDVDVGALLDHVAQHVHSFSLSSLPWPAPGTKEREYLGLKEQDGESSDYFALSSGNGSLYQTESTLSQIFQDTKLLLLKRKAAIPPIEITVDDLTQTSLPQAARKGDEAMVRHLLEKGADLEVRDGRYGATPLLWAALEGRERVVRLLL